jgi:uncharacterized alpha-E superfamily protein
MLSRVADSIYWMSCYIERAENTARFVDVVRHLVLDLPDQVTNQWESLVEATGDLEPFTRRYGDATEANVIRFLTFDRENPNSIYSCLCSARENARSVREAISSEMWEQINRSYLMVKDSQACDRIDDDPAAFFSHFKKACHLFVGITDTTMTHGDGWHFGRMGRLIERADKTSRMIDVKYYVLLPRVDYVGSPYDSLQWAALLKSLSAFEMYRKQFHQILPKHVAEFLILDRRFPRSMHYCLIKAEESLHVITGSPMATFSNLAEQRIGRLRAELDYADIQEILDAGLHEYLDEFQIKLNDFTDAVFKNFFASSPTPGLPQDTRGTAA